MKFFAYMLFIPLFISIKEIMDLFNDSDKIIFTLCILFLTTDTILAILCKYKNGKFEDVKSKHFILGITLKILIITLFLSASFIINYLVDINLKGYLLLVYLLYEFKSIDEHVQCFIKKSFINDFVKTLSFLNKLKKYEKE